MSSKSPAIVGPRHCSNHVMWYLSFKNLSRKCCMPTSLNMVYLTMTPAMVAALETICRHQLKLVNNEDDWECPLNNPIVGNPVCHSQVIAISRLLGSHEHLLLEETLSYHLDDLLRGSRIFRKPSKPKQEPVRCIICFINRAFLLMVSSRRLVIRL